jgi:hypothetical protein
LCGSALSSKSKVGIFDSVFEGLIAKSGLMQVGFWVSSWTYRTYEAPVNEFPKSTANNISRVVTRRVFLLEAGDSESVNEGSSRCLIESTLDTRFFGNESA